MGPKSGRKGPCDPVSVGLAQKRLRLALLGSQGENHLVRLNDLESFDISWLPAMLSKTISKAIQSLELLVRGCGGGMSANWWFADTTLKDN
jgi:hypothetical protein